jgi:copper homeostasis protein
VASKVVLEVCCGSLEDALAAARGGADRVELCAGLCVGGITPSLGAIREARARLAIPMVVLVRPRGAGFCYRETERASMERDLDVALQEGAEGVATGALHEDGSIDTETCARWRRMIGTREAVFHRAFDFTPNPFRALDQLVDLGFTRVLTSGQRTTALEGAETLRRLIEHARGRIEVLPGGGIRLHNVLRLVSETGCRQVHLTAFRSEADPSTQARPELGLFAEHPPGDQYQVTDPELVRRIAEALGAG